MKKFGKISAVLLAVLIMFSACPLGLFGLTASAEESTKTGGITGGCKWELDGTRLTISGNGEMGDYNSPWGSEITEVIIEDGVTGIGSCAFRNCTELTSITIPDSVTSIDRYAFSLCTGLTCIIIPVSVTSIGYSAFSGCTSLTSITVPGSITNIDLWTFRDCKIKDLTISEGSKCVTRDIIVCIDTFENVTIPDSVTSIGDSAFSGCTSLTSITIPDSVTSIGSGAFSGCNSLTSITIPDSVTSIGYHAFSDCTSLANITIPDSVTSICNYAFSNCTSLANITIPDSVTSIGGDVFNGCTSLTSITIPDSVTSIGIDALYDSGYYNNANNWEQNVLYIGNHFIKAKSEINGNYEIKSGTKTVAGSAFSGCTGLTNINIPDSVTSIDNYAFSGCTGLTNINIPDSVTGIGYSAFSGCTGLTSINIPYSVISIGHSAFSDCKNLESLKVAPNNSKYHDSGNCIIETETKVLIEGCNNSIIPADGSVTSIGDSAFYGRDGLTSIIIPDSVTSIDDWAFYNCNLLTSITIPDSVINIGSYAFHDTGYYNNTNNWEQNVLYLCNHLIAAKYEISGSYDIKDETKTIAGSAFAGCTSLTSITIPDSVTCIGEDAFYDCTELTNINIPDSVTGIGGGAFHDCTSLTSITIPDSVTGINYWTFSYCTSLTSIIIPDSVTSIGGGAFYGCPNVVIYGSAGSYAETFAKENGIKFVNGKPLGDANGDGRVDILDLISLKKRLAEYGEDAPAEENDPADVDKNNKLNASDIAALRKILLGIA